MQRRIRKKFKIDWKYVITELLLLVVGILLAINLNDLYASQKTRDQIELSLEQIKEEIRLNASELKEVTEINKKLNDFCLEIATLSSAEVNHVSCSTDKMTRLRKIYADQFIIKDSTSLGLGKYSYVLSINYELEYAELDDIAWKAAQLSTNVNKYGYDCLKNLLSVYRLQELYVQVQSKFLDSGSLEEEELIATLQLCHKLGTDLLERYDTLEKGMKECS
ncbi:MAG: hypothetical protein AAF740_12475 [Bacteroidota bacterium]